MVIVFEKPFPYRRKNKPWVTCFLRKSLCFRRSSESSLTRYPIPKSGSQTQLRFRHLFLLRHFCSLHL